MNICGKVESQEILARGPVWLEPDPFGAAPRPVGFNLEPKLLETYDENWFKTCNNEVWCYDDIHTSYLSRIVSVRKISIIFEIVRTKLQHFSWKCRFWWKICTFKWTNVCQYFCPWRTNDKYEVCFISCGSFLVTVKLIVKNVFLRLL